MRNVLLCACLLAAAPAPAAGASPIPPPPSAASLLRLHPGPWRFPVTRSLARVRFEPEAGEAAAVTTVPDDAAALRARAEAGVRTLPDGSRHAVLGGAIRSWTVATIDPRGRLLEDCVTSEAEARRLVETAAGRQVRK